MTSLARLGTSCLPALAVLAAAVVPAAAHQIDGTWCSADGRNLRISGPSIKTPGGREINGSYSRYNFDYVGPEGEADAGASVRMRLLTDEELSVVEPSRGGAKIWRRCQFTS